MSKMQQWIKVQHTKKKPKNNTIEHNTYAEHQVYTVSTIHPIGSQSLLDIDPDQ